MLLSYEREFVHLEWAGTKPHDSWRDVQETLEQNAHWAVMLIRLKKSKVFNSCCFPFYSFFILCKCDNSAELQITYVQWQFFLSTISAWQLWHGLDERKIVGKAWLGLGKERKVKVGCIASARSPQPYFPATLYKTSSQIWSGKGNNSVLTCTGVLLWVFPACAAAECSHVGLITTQQSTLFPFLQNTQADCFYQINLTSCGGQ